jgi:short-subunit dehydrogenase
VRKTGGVPVRGAVALVTGASRGIGRASALALAKRGATVVGVARDETALTEVSRCTGGEHIVADLSDASQPHRVVHEVLARHGRVDVLVANAGVGFAGPFTQMPVEQLTELLDVNLRAPMLLARLVLPEMVDRRLGAVVFVTSIAGAVLVPDEAAYSMTKAALNALAEPLREEVRSSGVSVSTVLPGAVDTDFFTSRGAPYRRRFPRPIPPERVAATIVEVIEGGAAQRLVPGWLSVAARFHALTPVTYRRVARRFGA